MELRSVAVEVGSTLYVRRREALEEGEWYLQNGNETKTRECDRRVIPRLEETLETTGSHLLFQLISACYERVSIIVTMNSGSRTGRRSSARND